MNMVEVVTSDTSFSVICNGEEVLVVAPTKNELMIHVVDDDCVQLVDLDEMPSEEMDLKVRGIHRIESLNSRRPGKSTSYSTTYDHSDEAEIQHCIDLILESYDINPDQSKAETSAETRRIAKEVFGSEEEKYRVAGVRAALTRGAYTITVPKRPAKKGKAGRKVENA